MAHPHGTLDCAVRLVAERRESGTYLRWVELGLTMDSASSQALAPRITLADAPPPSDAQTERQQRFTTQNVSGLLRHSGWMLQLRPSGASAEAAVELDDPEPARWRLNAEGRLQMSVRLQPAANSPPIALTGLEIGCRDPLWYWLAGFASADALQLAMADDGAPGSVPGQPGCQAWLGPMLAQSTQAQALQLAARQAGAAGADQMPEALRNGAAQRAATAAVSCRSQPAGP